jgi:hypothetical protein
LTEIVSRISYSPRVNIENVLATVPGQTLWHPSNVDIKTRRISGLRGVCNHDFKGVDCAAAEWNSEGF